MDSPRLDTLPTEILWRIAVLGGAEVTISCIRASRRLHEVFFDLVIFRRMLELSEDNHPWLATIVGRNELDTSAWAKLALADDRARNLLQLTFPRSATSPAAKLGANLNIQAKLDEFLPSLLTFKHPIVSWTSMVFVQDLLSEIHDQIPPHRTSRSYYPNGRFHDIISPGLAFCLCIFALETRHNLVREREATLSNILSTCGRTLEEVLSDEIQKYPYFDRYGEAFNLTLVHIALFAWSSLLRIHIEANGRPDDPRVPKPSNIPWLDTTLHRNPFPFEPTATRADMDSKHSTVSWTQWYKDRVAFMTNPAYLTQGEWCGYWSLDTYGEHDVSSVEFAEAIHRMVLVMPNRRRSPRFANGVESIRITATYPGRPGGFILEGSISPDGVFDLGPPGDFWVWRGRMTPFGLFGFWGDAEFSQISGACWLWKKTWCEQPEVAAQ